jgi:spoIIIJ-associated protein
LKQSVEATGKTLEEAKQAALRLLGAESAAEVRFEELPDDTGLFGWKRKRVRASIGGGAAVAEESGGRAAREVPTDTMGAGEPIARPGDEEEDLEEEPGEVTVGPADITRARALVQSIVDSARMRVSVRHQKTEGRYIHLEMSGPDVPHVIGRRGVVIDALQYLVNVIFCKESGGDGARLVLDADGYRARRTETLQSLALDLARQVRERGEEAELEALPAHERRVVHRTLKDDADVRTYSEGVEPDRRVVISPREAGE